MYDLLIKLITWIKNMLTDLLVSTLDGINTAIFSIIDSLFALCPTCTPAALTGSIDSALAAIPSTMMWVLGWFNFDFGMTAISGAYLIRFLIRRLPVIG